MKLSIKITDERSGLNPFAVTRDSGTVTIAEAADVELTQGALVGVLRALADDLDPDAISVLGSIAQDAS